MVAITDSYIAPNGDKISSTLTLLIKEYSVPEMAQLCLLSVVVAAAHPASAAAPLLLLLLSEYQLEFWLPFPLGCRFHSRYAVCRFHSVARSSVSTLSRTLLQPSLNNLPSCDSPSTVLFVDANAPDASIDPVDYQLE